MNRFIDSLRRFDAYPKTLDDFRIQTYGGAAVTVISSLIMIVLFVSELSYFLSTEVHPELFVDTSKEQKLRINIDASLLTVNCQYLSLDAMDISGEQQIDINYNIDKEAINKEGVQASTQSELKKENVEMKKSDATAAEEQCGSCYGANTEDIKCCNTCEELKHAYRRKGWNVRDVARAKQCQNEESRLSNDTSGCRIHGYLDVNRVAGNFHIAPGKSFQQHHIHSHDAQGLLGRKFNLSHVLNHVSFGVEYPGQVNPLDSLVEISDKDSIMYQYYLKIVPTTYVKLSGAILHTNQYSVTVNKKVITGDLFSDSGIPGLFFTYELSPMTVKYTEKRRSFLHFATGVCAIVGGVFTVAGLFDAFLYRSTRVLQEKLELGKAS